MNFKQGIAARWLMVSMASLLATAPLAAATLQQMDALAKQVEQLNGQCEAARQKALAPIRAQKTKACIDFHQALLYQTGANAAGAEALGEKEV